MPGTLVLMAGGSSKAIEDIDLGEFVLATDPLTGQTTAQEVKDLITGDGEKDLVTITADADGDGQSESIEATAGHPFHTTNRGWIDAGELQVGDLLAGTDGTVIEVTALTHETRVAVVHNLTIDRIPSYYVFVDGEAVLAHNCGKSRWIPKKKNYKEKKVGFQDRASATAAARRDATVGGRCRFRDVCSSGNHVHVDYLNARGQIFFTRYTFPK